MFCKERISLCVLSIFLFHSTVFSYVIDTEGELILGDDIFEITGDVVTIAADNVKVDLDGHIIAGGATGIVINPGVSNVQIKNGVVAGVAEAGISVGAGCSNIVFSDLVIQGCGQRGIELLGSSTAMISEVVFSNIRVQSCCIASSGDYGVFINYGKNILFDDIKLVNNVNSSKNISLIRFEDSIQCLGQKVYAINNTGSSLVVFDYINPTNCSLRDSIATNNKAIGVAGSLDGFKFTGTATGNIIARCTVLGCVANGNAHGFDLGSNAFSNIIRGCEVAELHGDRVCGFVISGTGSPSSSYRNIFEDCSVLNGEAENNFSAGFVINGADAGTISKSNVSHNSSKFGSCIGMWFMGVGGNHWNISNNSIVRNIGIDDSSSFGIKADAGLNNLFLQNFAFDNGQTGTHQMVGVPSGSVAEETVTTINNITVPWSNVVIS